MAIGKSKIKIPQSISKNDLIKVQCIVLHPMETGRAKDQAGNIIPAHYIDFVKVTYGDDEICSFETGTGISKNPYFAFYVRATKSAPLKITFTDNKGGRFTNSVDIVLS